MTYLDEQMIYTYLQNFPHGSYVVVKYRLGLPPTRLHTMWKGPLKVVNNNKSEYLLLDLIKNKEIAYHASDMKTFNYDPLLTDPIDIARRDYLEFFVEKVLEIKGDPKRLTTLTFLIQWLGFDESFNSWEPWKNVRDVDKLHQYLRENNLAKIIPKQFRA